MSTFRRVSIFLTLFTLVLVLFVPPVFAAKERGAAYKIGLSYYDKKDYWQAAKYFEEYVNMSNDISDEQKFVIGDAFINTENYYQGKKYLDKIDNPKKLTNKSSYYIAKALLEGQQKEYDKAVEYTDKVLKNKKEKNGFFVKKARVIKIVNLIQKNDKSVVAEMKKMVSVPFSNVDYYTVNTYLLLLSNIDPNFDEFMTTYVEKADPLTNAFFYTTFGMIYRGKGEVEKAKLSYEKAVTQYPAFVPAYLEYERMYRDQDDFKTALEYYKKVAQIYPTYFKANNGIGWSYYELVKGGQLDKQYYDVAVEHLLSVNKNNPEYSRAYNTIGVIYLEKKYYQKAIEYFHTALKYEDYAKPYGNLASAYEALGDFEKAKEYWDKSLMFPNN